MKKKKRKKAEDRQLSSREAAMILDCCPDDLYKLMDLGMIDGGFRGTTGRYRWYSEASVHRYKRYIERRKGCPDE